MSPNPTYRMQRILAHHAGKPLLIAIFFTTMLTASCRTKKEAVYRWEGKDESRSLTLKRNDAFILEIDAGYYFRVDSGTFLQKGDTLVINTGKGPATIDSLIEMDSLYFCHRFVEVMQPVIDFGMDNEITGAHYKGVIFPQVVVNDTLDLLVDPDDATYRKVHIPDSVDRKSVV